MRGRSRTIALTALEEDELTAQHSPLMSPLVWDLAHIGNQEELWLVRDVGGRAPVRRDIDRLYDAFQHSRASRPSLPLLSPLEARGYVATVRGKVLDILDSAVLTGDPLRHNAFAFGMIAQHEQQHAETMLATHQLRRGPAVLTAPPAPRQPAALSAEVIIPAGEFVMGASTEAWALDNERPAHPVYVGGYAIDTTPVTNAHYRCFVADGGYTRPELWSTPGWEHRRRAGLQAPQFWEQDHEGTWWRRRFGVREPVPDTEPVLHVCFHEAQAYARWAGKRLPTEAEWEKSARWDPRTGRTRRYPWGDEDPTPAHANLGQRHLQPAAVGAYPAGASASGVHQLIGDVWEWCDSPLRPYPGFAAFPYEEYSQVFFDGDYRILRGGSFGTDEVVARGTFRNWDHPIRRQIFAGFRCARDLTPDERG
ncbi:MAG: ergothioneine biosynthesis protein EgtB [Mycobacteriaceae bacterium]